MGRHLRAALAVAEPDGVAGSHHDVVRSGATHHSLVVVVAHSIVIGKGRQIRRIASQDVVEGHRGRAFTRGRFGEGIWPRFTIGSGADANLNPRKKVSVAAARVV